MSAPGLWLPQTQPGFLWCRQGGIGPLPHSLCLTTSAPSPAHDGTLPKDKGKNLVADVILDADGDAVEQPLLLVPLYLPELLLTLWDKVSEAVCLLGHFQGLCWTCGGAGVR